MSYTTEQETTRAVVEWRGAGEALASAAHEIANTAMSIGYAIHEVASAWKEAAGAVEDAANEWRRAANRMG